MSESKNQIEKLDSKDVEKISGGYIVDRSKQTEDTSQLAPSDSKKLMPVPNGRPLPVEMGAQHKMPPMPVLEHHGRHGGPHGFHHFEDYNDKQDKN